MNTKLIEFFKKEIRLSTLEDVNFLKYFFPECEIYFNDIPTFFDPNKIIVIFDELKNQNNILYSSMYNNIIILHKGTSKTSIKSKKVLIELLLYLEIELTENELKHLNTLSEKTFFEMFSILYVTRDKNLIFKDIKEVKNSNSFLMFKYLFTAKYDYLYKLYITSDTYYQVLFSALLTMMLKAKNLDNLSNLSDSYKQILAYHKEHNLGKFGKALYKYSQTNCEEQDFLNFLFLCSTDYKEIN